MEHNFHTALDRTSADDWHVETMKNHNVNRCIVLKRMKRIRSQVRRYLEANQNAQKPGTKLVLSLIYDAWEYDIFDLIMNETAERQGGS